MALGNIPLETFLEIIQYLGVKDLYSLLLTARWSSALADEQLYKLAPKHKCEAGKGVLQWAIVQQQKKVFERLLQANADIHSGKDSILHILASRGNTELMHSLLAIRNDINFYKQNIWGETALAVAVKENHIGIVTQLLEVGVDPFTDDYRSMLPPAMGHAIVNRNLSMLQLLCDVKDCMVKCKNALEIAVLQPGDGKDIRLQMIRTLLDAGFDPSAMHTEESTPLHTAAHFRLPRVLDIFLDNASNINVQDHVGRTILHRVVQYLPEKIERVIEAGIDTCIRDQWGKTALDLARNQSPGVMRLLAT